MAQQELEAALRREGATRVQQIWQDAETEAARLRAASARTLQQLHESEALQLEGLCAQKAEEIVIARQHAVRRFRLEAEQRLAARLEALARARLPQLALGGGAGLFKALAEEVPPGDWRIVRVNPRDRAVAQGLFPQAEIAVDPAICGGLKVEDASTCVVIDNVLTKRLQHFWPLLLPALLEQLRGKVGNDETA